MRARDCLKIFQATISDLLKSVTLVFMFLFFLTLYRYRDIIAGSFFNIFFE